MVMVILWDNINIFIMQQTLSDWVFNFNFLSQKDTNISARPPVSADRPNILLMYLLGRFPLLEEKIDAL